MDALEFVSRSEWPIVAVIGIWLVRRPLARMLDRINPTKVDAWGFRAEFNQRLERVEQLTISTETDTGQETDSVDTSGTSAGKASHFIVSSPELTILDLWNNFEKIVRDKTKLELRPRPFRGPLATVFDISPGATDAISQMLGFDQKDMGALVELRKLRNQVAHWQNASLTFEDANRYKEAVDRLIHRIEEKEKMSKKQTNTGPI